MANAVTLDAVREAIQWRGRIAVVRIPQLGPRGEGWVLGQLLLLAAIGGAGFVALGQPFVIDAGRLALAASGTVAIIAGAIVAVRGVLDLGSSLTPFPRPADANRLVESGVYRYVRHPIYSGIVLAGIGWATVTTAPAAAGLSLVLLLWFDLKARNEEAWLVERHPGYARYQARTRKFIPFVY